MLGWCSPDEREEHMKLNSLHELFVNELRDLYDAENQIVKALPKMAEKASYPQLKDAILTHLEETKGQVRRLEECFESIGESVKSEKCEGVRGIIDEGEDLAKKGGEPAAIDAGIIASAQKVEHYEIAAYGTVCTWAEMMGHQQALQLLRMTLDEEKTTDAKLTDIAESLINVDAVRAAGGRMHGEL
jgi:ferritin-like metal-binding protein YciE